MNSDSQTVAEARKVVQELCTKVQAWQCCLNCINWNARDETCAKFGARPPATIIVHGCRDHENDIPF